MSTTAIQIFRPNVAATKRITAATGGTPVLLAGDPLGREYQVRVRNYSTIDVHVEFHTSSTGTASLPVANGAAGSLGVTAGGVEVFTVKGNYVAVISSGAIAVEVTPGYGA
jgi:hypothetical protein